VGYVALKDDINTIKGAVSKGETQVYRNHARMVQKVLMMRKSLMRLVTESSLLKVTKVVITKTIMLLDYCWSNNYR
jgi:hypothetical protein